RHTRFSRDWSSDVCSSDLVKSRLTCPKKPPHCSSKLCFSQKPRMLSLSSSSSSSAHFVRISLCIMLVILRPPPLSYEYSNCEPYLQLPYRTYSSHHYP